MAKAIPTDSRYIALTTYRRDGREVTTPVWSVPLGTSCMLHLEGDRQGQAVRATGRVRFAPCNMSGRRILGEWQDGRGHIVEDQVRLNEALAALQRKYGWQLSLAMLVYRLRGVHRDRMVLELTSSPAT